MSGALGYAFNPLGKIASAVTGREYGVGAALGGTLGSLAFDKKPPPPPPTGQLDPRIKRSTDSPSYGRGSSSLSI